MSQVTHRSQGNPCAKCGQPSLKHNRQHIPDTLGVNGICSCGARASQHQKVSEKTQDKKRVRQTVEQSRAQSKRYREKHKGEDNTYYVGIDGEGQGKEVHKYILLAWSNYDGSKREYIENENGLSTEDCLNFILTMPNNARPFAYAFGYDLTKILTDVDDKILYKLFRPELRARLPKFQILGPKPVRWKDFILNLQGTKFSIKKANGRFSVSPEGVIKPKYNSKTVWDIFKFFQGKFTNALEDWKVGEKTVLDNMREMKDKRSDFDKLNRDQIREYCFDECKYMAVLAEKLTLAHEAAGLELKSYYGAGSTASCILKKSKINEQKRDALPEMRDAISSAFFGGRFENSVIGEVEGPVWGYDISSAYPYQITFLPCLECGKWEHTTNRKDIDNSTTALVRYVLHPSRKKLVWGPFPFRFKNGSIAFPAESGGGWIYKDEFLAGERLFDGVEFKEAWVYNTSCDHQHFKSIPDYYLERLRIGKEGPGIVIKLGVNACYGKLAQSTGVNPPFQSWVWASMITSGTRGQLLDVLGLHKHWDNCLMMATDGVYTRERLKMPVPRDTGTMNEFKKPLGGWEEKEVPKGLFLARPGIYFPLNPNKEELKQVRARGLGRAVMFEAWKSIIQAFKEKKETIQVANVSRFMGAKSCISYGPISKEYTRSDKFGQWITRPIEMSFNPMPKRERINSDNTLLVRKVPMSETSKPYNKSVISPEALQLKRQLQEVLEQPDADLTDYESEDV